MFAFELATQSLENNSSKRSFLKIASWLDGRPLYPGEAFDLIEDASATLHSISPELKSALERGLMSQYERFLKTAPDNMSQKRVVDIMLNILANPAQKLKRDVDSGLSPTKSYQNFINLRRSYLRNQEGYAEYRAEDVIHFAKQIQNQLRNQFPDLELTLGGSLPNGLAHIKKSDLDILADTARLTEQEQNTINSMLTQMARRSFGENSQLSATEITPLTFQNHFSAANSFMIRIRSDGVYLLSTPPDLRYGNNPNYLENTNIGTLFKLD
jgi:hypothetical protein